MERLIKAKRQTWLKYKPPTTRDIRKRHLKFWSLEDAEHERAQRIKILNGGGDVDRRLAKLLEDALHGKPACVMCCPIVAREFQIFFSGRAMKIAERHGEGIALTLVDPNTALPFGDLGRVDWRTLHQQLRRRLERCLGKHVVVVGMGEVEADYEKKVWQPHYHLIAFKTCPSGLQTLRDKHYRPNGDGIRKMKVQRLVDDGWYPYSSKLVAFRKIIVVGSDGRERGCRKRLKVGEFRQYMGYLAMRQATEFLFSMNCSILKSDRQQ